MEAKKCLRANNSHEEKRNRKETPSAESGLGKFFLLSDCD
jgi:hypothetical protein